MIRKYNNLSLLIGGPGLILQAVGYRSDGHYSDVQALMFLGGTVMLIAGLALYAKAKGRSGAWGLFGLLSLVGLIVLGLLKDRSAPS